MDNRPPSGIGTWKLSGDSPEKPSPLLPVADPDAPADPGDGRSRYVPLVAHDRGPIHWFTAPTPDSSAIPRPSIPSVDDRPDPRRELWERVFNHAIRAIDASAERAASIADGALAEWDIRWGGRGVARDPVPSSAVTDSGPSEMAPNVPDPRP